MDPHSRSAADRELPVRALLAFTLLLGTAPAGAQSKRDNYACSAEVRSGPTRAISYREIAARGQLRETRTSFETSFPGRPTVMMSAEWNTPGLPEVARGRYSFSVARIDPAAEAAQLQLLIAGRMIARSGWASGRLQPVIQARGRDLGAAWFAGTPVAIRLVAPDGRLLSTTLIAREGVDRAMDLARQANASVLAKATDFRRQCEPAQVITAA